MWLWGHDAYAPWHFVSVPKKETAKIREDFGKLSRGWQSLPIEIKIGKSVWKTSMFYDKKSNTYLVPLKAQVRKKEGIYADEHVTFQIKILA